MTRMKLKEDEIVKCLLKFKNENPWAGSVEERKNKFLKLHNELNIVFHKNVKLVFEISDKISEWFLSKNSYYDAGVDTIVLMGRLSVITYLHEYGHSLNMRQEEAIMFSQDLFRKVFPEKWEKLNGDNFLVLKTR